MNKNESKYFNTAIRMDEALITLLEKKDFEYITIMEICETAGVNRSTFYLHYENTFDLLRETTRYILDKHFAYYSSDTKGITERFVNCEREDLVFITSEYLYPYLTFIKDNQRIFKVSIKHFHSLGMDDVYGKMFKHIFNPYQATNCIFHRARTDNFTICMEIPKKTSNSQSNLEKEEWNWRNQLA